MDRRMGRANTARRRSKLACRTPAFDPAVTAGPDNDVILARLIAGNDIGTPAVWDGTNYTNNEIADMYVLPQWSQFSTAMEAVALGECGGTLTLQTKLGGGPAPDPVRYQHSVVTDSSGVPLDLEPTVVTTNQQFVTGTFDFPIPNGQFVTIDVAAAELLGTDRLHPRYLDVPGRHRCSGVRSHRHPRCRGVDGHQGASRSERGRVVQLVGDPMNSQDATQGARPRDRGSVLPLVLVMMIIGSLIVIPTMTYAMSVLRANAVLSDKTMRIESAKAGLRLSLADPVRLYRRVRCWWALDAGPARPVDGERCRGVDRLLLHRLRQRAVCGRTPRRRHVDTSGHSTARGAQGQHVVCTPCVADGALQLRTVGPGLVE